MTLQRGRTGSPRKRRGAFFGKRRGVGERNLLIEVTVGCASEERASGVCARVGELLTLRRTLLQLREAGELRSEPREMRTGRVEMERKPSSKGPEGRPSAPATAQATRQTGPATRARRTLRTGHSNRGKLEPALQLACFDGRQKVDQLRGSVPDLKRDAGVNEVSGRLRGKVTAARNAQDGQSVQVGSALGAKTRRACSDVLAVQGGDRSGRPDSDAVHKFVRVKNWFMMWLSRPSKK